MAMIQSLFPQYVQKYFPQYVASITERLNGRSLNDQIPFMFNSMLRPSYSPEGRWEAVSADYQNVAADVIALGSSTPLKSRDALQVSVGDLPKLGTKRSLNEREMKTIETMIAQNRPIGEIVNRIFTDVPFVINAVDIRIEELFLSMLSTGYGVAQKNVGEGVRFDMKFLNDNRFSAKKAAWTSTGATPVDDIQQVVDKADYDGNVIRFCYADDTALNALYNSEQVRSVFAFQNNFAGGGNNTPALDFAQLEAMFLRKWNITLVRVRSNIRTEVDGIRSSHKAWKDGGLTFTCDNVVGDLVYTSCAEETHPVGGVSYQMANAYTLVSRYAEQEPLLEFTRSQAMVLPIINNVHRIYTLDSTIVAG